MDLELTTAIRAAQAAGDILMGYFEKTLDIKYKADNFDPVTEADKAADEFLRKTIADAFPKDSMLTEENVGRPDSYGGRVWRWIRLMALRIT